MTERGTFDQLVLLIEKEQRKIRGNVHVGLLFYQNLAD